VTGRVDLKLVVNGRARRVLVPPMKRLLDVLRQDLGLTGTKEGCGEGECGACTVLLDGVSVNSCLVPAFQADGQKVVTVEGLAVRSKLSRLQQAFVEMGGAQCGICTPGILVSARELLARSSGRVPSEAEVREALAGNLCRCTGYQKIVDAVRAAAAAARRTSHRIGRPPRPRSPSRRAITETRVRSALSKLEVVRPRRLTEALSEMAEAASRERPTPIAGGTDLFVYLNAGELGATRYLDLLGLRELRGIQVRRDAVVLGALTTFHEIRTHPAIVRRLPSLAAAAAEVGALQIQHRATIAGNVANASPAGDSLPVLLAHDAERLYTGYRTLATDPDELITAISIPTPPSGAFAFFRKVGTRRAQSISKVVFAGLLASDKRHRSVLVRFAYGSVAPTPVRARNAEQALIGEPPSAAAAARAQQALARDIAPIDDIRSERDYRMTVAGNVLDQFLRAADPRFMRGS